MIETLFKMLGGEDIKEDPEDYRGYLENQTLSQRLPTQKSEPEHYRVVRIKRKTRPHDFIDTIMEVAATMYYALS